jgi:hypothetical protein
MSILIEYLLQLLVQGQQGPKFFGVFTAKEADGVEDKGSVRRHQNR